MKNAGTPEAERAATGRSAGPTPRPMMNGDIVDVLGRCGWRQGVYLRRAGALHRVFVLDIGRAILFSPDRTRPAAHRVSIETVVKSRRRRDPPRSRWSCSCGAGRRGLTTPKLAHAAADEHFQREMAR